LSESVLAEWSRLSLVSQHEKVWGQRQEEEEEGAEENLQLILVEAWLGVVEQLMVELV